MSGMTGKKHSQESKEKMRLAKLGKFDKTKNPFYGKKHSEETKEKMRLAKLQNPNRYWLGKKRSDDTIKKIRDSKMIKLDKNSKYGTIHTRIKILLGTPNYCEICKRTDKGKYDWSNKDHKYNLDLSDWQRLCRSCHIKYDKENNGYFNHSIERNKKASEKMKEICRSRKEND